ncbi:hypothetical protein JMN32_02940 [Fulvivirga sp. 29W222]|uniref:PorV/PorQ family protein n=1 Tax=Fulvivirga marina TaxID=2494733 RepID=A0A937KCH7_9BACT|nr:hypothetical protein [Fulvivirga marina]MBL6445248.1 hypothetical protein [Fulvivirga marina]
MKHLYGTLFFLLLFFVSEAQNGQSQIGARGAAMGYAVVATSDSWSSFNNPAGLYTCKNINGLFAFENKYGIAGFNSIAAGIVSPMLMGGVGISVFRFGDDLYNEQTAAISYGNRFGLAGIGIRVNYLQYHIEGYGNKGIFTVNFGGIAELSKKLYFGALIRNINQAKLSDFENEHIPTILNAGLSFHPSDKIYLNAEIEKDVDLDAVMRIGLEYSFLKKLLARIGIKTKSFNSYFGLGLVLPRLKIDYALTVNPNIGYNHQAALTYNFIKL